jgi:hypothetical protein
MWECVLGHVVLSRSIILSQLGQVRVASFWRAIRVFGVALKHSGHTRLYLSVYLDCFACHRCTLAVLSTTYLSQRFTTSKGYVTRLEPNLQVL